MFFFAVDVSVLCSASITVRELKKLVEVAAKVPADVQRLIFAGHVLKDESTLESYKVRERSKMVVRSEG